MQIQLQKFYITDRQAQTCWPCDLVFWYHNNYRNYSYCLQSLSTCSWTQIKDTQICFTILAEIAKDFQLLRGVGKHILFFAYCGIVNIYYYVDKHISNCHSLMNNGVCRLVKPVWNTLLNWVWKFNMDWENMAIMCIKLEGVL